MTLVDETRLVCSTLRTRIIANDASASVCDDAMLLLDANCATQDTIQLGLARAALPYLHCCSTSRRSSRAILGECSPSLDCESSVAHRLSSTS